MLLLQLVLCYYRYCLKSLKKIENNMEFKVIFNQEKITLEESSDININDWNTAGNKKYIKIK